MEHRKKPKIALLALMTDGYENIFEGITKRQEGYANEIIDTLSEVVDIYYTGAAKNRAEIEAAVKEYNNEDVDGMLIVLLAYSQGAWITRAMKDNKLPIAISVIQPDHTVLPNFKELDLTVNQGIHGAQDNCNIMMRQGIKYQIFVGDRRGRSFVNFVEDFSKACKAIAFLKKMRTAVFCKMQGMGDVLLDELGFFEKIGAEICHDTIGSVHTFMKQVTQEEVLAQIEKDKAIADIDSNLSFESHSEAVKIYLGFKKYLEANKYDAFTAHFDIFAADGRFSQLPLYAASHLMADGYGYAAEGDCVTASMVAAGHAIGSCDANFTEMYFMDFKKEAILFCHAGEGNWSTYRKDVKPRLIDRYLGEGGLANPPTFIFTPEVGSATLTSLVSLGGGKFRLLVSHGNILPYNELYNCEMPYFFWKPDRGMTTMIQDWLRFGGAHHEVINLGDLRKRYKMFCEIADIEYVEV